MNLAEILSRMTIEERAELRKMLEEPEPTSYGEVLRANLWPSGSGDTPWDTVSAADRASYERCAAAVIAEYERRNPRPRPTVDEVADAIGKAADQRMGASLIDHLRNLARAVFPLFGCEP